VVVRANEYKPVTLPVMAFVTSTEIGDPAVSARLYPIEAPATGRLFQVIAVSDQDVSATARTCVLVTPVERLSRVSTADVGGPANGST
jgi:hypothetical protein